MTNDKPTLSEIWNKDAPEGMLWQCPDCDCSFTLGGNAGYHAISLGHRLPSLAKMPAPAAPVATERPTVEKQCRGCSGNCVNEEGRFYCEKCGREWHVETHGLKTFGLSNYPGEFRVVEAHPKNDGADWYSRKEANVAIEEIERQRDELAERLAESSVVVKAKNETIAQLTHELGRSRHQARQNYDWKVALQGEVDRITTEHGNATIELANKASALAASEAGRVKTNRELHEDAADMGLCDAFFAVSGINPDSTPELDRLTADVTAARAELQEAKVTIAKLEFKVSEQQGALQDAANDFNHNERELQEARRERDEALCRIMCQTCGQSIVACNCVSLGSVTIDLETGSVVSDQPKRCPVAELRAQLAALREEREKLPELLIAALGPKFKRDRDFIEQAVQEINALRADRDALAKALDWYSRNRDSVRYIAPHWYSGYIDEQSPNPNEWRSTGQWLTFRDAVSAAIRGGKQEWEG